MKNLLLILRKHDEPSARFRYLSYLPRLKLDFNVSVFFVEPRLGNRIRFLKSPIKILSIFALIFRSRKYDVIVMQRPMTSTRKKTAIFEKLISRFNKNIVFDMDDAIFVPNPVQIQSILNISALCICGNEFIRSYCSQYNANSVVVPTGIDVAKFKPKAQALISDEKNNIVIGWTGTSGNYQYFSDELKQSIRVILSSRRNVELIIISDELPDSTFDFPYTFLPWRSLSEVEDLQKIDIGLMPLDDSDWARGKCGFKIIQYGSIGIPALASPVGVNSEIIINNQTGVLVPDGFWQSAMERLIDDTALRTAMGMAARERVEMRYSTNVLYEEIKRILDSFAPIRQ